MSSFIESKYPVHSIQSYHNFEHCRLCLTKFDLNKIDFDIKYLNEDSNGLSDILIKNNFKIDYLRKYFLIIYG